MAHVNPSNRVAATELRELFQRSGLSRKGFAHVLGLPTATFQDMLNGLSLPTGAIVNGARFVLLRLGHTVEIKPIDESVMRGLVDGRTNRAKHPRVDRKTSAPMSRK